MTYADVEVPIMPYIISQGERVNIRETGHQEWLAYEMEDSLSLADPIAEQKIGTVKFLIFVFKGWEIRVAERKVRHDTRHDEPHERTHRDVPMEPRKGRTPGVKRGVWIR